MSDVLRVGDRSPRVAEVRATLARLGLLPSFDGYVIDKEAQQFEEKTHSSTLPSQRHFKVFNKAAVSSPTARSAKRR